jgi:hypothetical protein
MRTCLAFANQILPGDLVPRESGIVNAKQIAGIDAGEKFVLHINNLLTNIF